MEEQNEKDDRREHALVEYEKWKKQKNRLATISCKSKAIDGLNLIPAPQNSDGRCYDRNNVVTAL